MARPASYGPVMAAVQGGETARQARRQAMLDQAALLQKQDEMAFRRAVEERQAAQAQAQAEMQRAQLEETRRGNTIRENAEGRAAAKDAVAERRAAVEAAMSGWKPYGGTDKVAQAVAPLKDVAQANTEFMHDNGLAPDAMNPADPGRLLGDARGVATGIHEQERQDALNRAHASAARIDVQERRFNALPPTVGDRIRANVDVAQQAASVQEDAQALGDRLPHYLGVKVFELEQKVAAQDPQVAAFVAKARTLVSTQVKALSGAAASDQERAYIEAQLPNTNDTLEALLLKGENLRKLAEWRVANDLRGERANSRDVSGWEKEYGIRVDDYRNSPWVGHGSPAADANTVEIAPGVRVKGRVIGSP